LRSIAVRQLDYRALIAAALLAPAIAAAAPVVSVATGKLDGVASADIESFKGIPFAAPPVGELRWRAPQPAAAWEGVRSAAAFGHDCMQQPFAGDDAPLTTTPAEDCLYLNVWRPAHAQGKKLPVLVWIYGGGFVNGGSSPDIYQGSQFARDGIVYVSFNYRVGRFGFFGFPELSRQDADRGLLGNYGYMDQLAALKWVQANIAAFGGDPAQVTIFGESAGGASVNFLLTSPLSQGLFARVIVQSDGAGRGSRIGMRDLHRDRTNLPSSETLGLRFAERMGIAGKGADALAALRALPADKVTDGLNLAAWSDDAGGPMIDGQLVAGEAWALHAAGRQAKVPLMIGATSDDVGNANAKSKDEAFAGFGTGAGKARAAYDRDGTKSLARVNAEIGMDRVMVEPARFVAAAFARQGVPSYAYRFSYTATPRRAKSPHGAPHATEIPFIMDTLGARYGAGATAQDQAMAKTMHAYWLNFARTGNPNGPGLPSWPVYAPAKDWIMDFSADGQAVPQPDPWKARLDAASGIERR
jgi:para-nitrobenzyl esterase